jgi:glutathione-regulated potassium-efflux system ancillary protein KefG
MFYMKNILFLFAHPNPHKSRANKMILEHVRSLPNIKIHDLYQNYPNFFIDVKKEQQFLMASDLIVMQHPIYWYNMPALLKQWHDDVLELGFAYGENGNALKGKKLLLSITTGGGANSYSTEGHNQYPIDHFLAPYKATAHLCGMEWLEPLIFHSALRSDENEIYNHAEKARQMIFAYSSQS